eukprot:CAMPEP_0196784882 /NCGR_PEP_ID=MMETSP1104-20130614/18021_1 /TAXON_ID=33652 /ORGANISM="Cafeteria sp., Strain Caron Lab Isolate" /LENGTH=43 /DNA_ID= /DNA_START= /DNA_END= /DNA_ORIENTATION=
MAITSAAAAANDAAVAGVTPASPTSEDLEGPSPARSKYASSVK